MYLNLRTNFLRIPVLLAVKSSVLVLWALYDGSGVPNIKHWTRLPMCFVFCTSHHNGVAPSQKYSSLCTSPLPTASL